jgi:hypothetical protein
VSLETKIDELYRSPLADFVSARTALAKTLTGDEAARVKALAKPTVVPWAVNQVYWRARAVHDRLIKSGARLRSAQVAVLEGKKSDIREATDAHRRAIADAVKQAENFSAEAGAKPAADALMRTFEAISLSSEGAGPAGRLTKPLRPAGFEALAGIKVAAAVTSSRESAVSPAKSSAEQKKLEAATKKKEAEIKRAEAALARARKKMAEAEAALAETKGRR